METIKSSAEISSFFKYGKRFSNSYLTFIVGRNKKQHDHFGRAAFIAGKKIGNAVWRNKAKRRMRSICFDLGGPWANYDVIFLAKSTVTEESYSKVLEVCELTLSKIGVR